MLVYTNNEKQRANTRAAPYKDRCEARSPRTMEKFEPCVPLTAILSYQYKSTLYGARRRICSTVCFTRLPFLRSGCTAICTATAGGEGL